MSCSCNKNNSKSPLKEDIINLNEIFNDDNDLGTLYNQSNKKILENFEFTRRSHKPEDGYADKLISENIKSLMNGTKQYLTETTVDAEKKKIYTPLEIKAWVKFGKDNGLVDTRSKNSLQDWVKLLRTSVVDLQDLVDDYETSGELSDEEDLNITSRNIDTEK
jgi:Fe-S-cluster formation regulator IscX/YfhJ